MSFGVMSYRNRFVEPWRIIFFNFLFYISWYGFDVKDSNWWEAFPCVRVFVKNQIVSFLRLTKKNFQFFLKSSLWGKKNVFVVKNREEKLGKWMKTKRVWKGNEEDFTLSNCSRFPDDKIRRQESNKGWLVDASPSCFINFLESKTI